MLIKQNQEKNKEMKNDLQRQIRTKEMFEKTKKELEELKRVRIMQHENALKNERNFIEKHVQDLDEEINEKINRKQQELNNWNHKMDNLINDEDRQYNEHKDMKRSNWEDNHINEKDRLATINEENGRYMMKD